MDDVERELSARLCQSSASIDDPYQVLVWKTFQATSHVTIFVTSRGSATVDIRKNFNIEKYTITHIAFVF